MQDAIAFMFFFDTILTWKVRTLLWPWGHNGRNSIWIEWIPSGWSILSKLIGIADWLGFKHATRDGADRSSMENYSRIDIVKPWTMVSSWEILFWSSLCRYEQATDCIRYRFTNVINAATLRSWRRGISDAPSSAIEFRKCEIDHSRTWSRQSNAFLDPEFTNRRFERSVRID